MSPTQAKNLKPGDDVVACNGVYIQDAKVVSIRPHHREGFWIKFRWTDPKGVVKEREKTNRGLYLPREVYG